MEIFYGVEGKYTNVTHICYNKLISNNILRIPASERDRASIFGDPVPNVLKHIKIGNIIYTHEEEIILTYDMSNINMEDYDLKTYRKKWWNKFGKFIKDPEERLKSLHDHIILDFGSMSDEYPEQLMAMKYINETDTVLEIGGNIGRNSCIIASILDDDSRLIVLECGELYARQLNQNREKNYFNFQIELSALSKVPLIQQGWNTFVSEIVPPGYTKVNTITFTELCNKYNLTFNVLVADCEGALYQILKDEPNLLKSINTIIIENDFTEMDKKNYVHNVFLENGFHLEYNQAGGWGPCFSCFFQVYKK